ncbi:MULTISPECIES: Tn3 family transposase [Streptomyces]|uniref:Tn3 transposase DDE domain-containing protein n=2 Tax=Streptomyces TaxID=1883 RepID=A0A2N8PHR1_STRNR|nr:MULTISPECIES: Tn3 family transposase [Streptomyces]PNE40547.1 hypothetical protein AOB60_06475 [Streptomyces noursei]SHM94094.1 Tn3 transposase DDE domain-containing protein [Streptomyces yunnanensis]
MLCSAPPAETVDDRLLDTEELARRRRTEDGDISSTVQLLRYLTDGPLRRRVTAATNKVESFNRFSQWIGFGNRRQLLEEG